MKSELSETIEELGNAFCSFKAEQKNELLAMKKQVYNLETVVGRGGNGGSSARGDGLSVEGREHSKAFTSWARRGDGFGALKSLEIKAGLSSDSLPDGGVLLVPELATEISQLAQASVAMRRLATSRTCRTDYILPISRGGTGTSWVGEKDSRAVTASPTLAEIAIPMREWCCSPQCTQKLLDESSFDVSTWLVNEISRAAAAVEGAAFISGEGVNCPKGIGAYTMIANSAYTWGKIGFIASGHATLLNDCDTLINLQHALSPSYRGAANWLMNNLTFATIRKLKDGDGNYIWRPGLLANEPDTLLGRPVFIDDNVDDIGAGKYPIFFGDFKQAYLIIDGIGPVLLRDPYSSKPHVIFYTTRRVGGGIINYEAIKALKISA